MKTNIIFEDAYIWVIYKPSGLATQSAKVTQTDVVSELRAATNNGYVGLVHRLDQPVEGLLVVGKTKEITGALSTQLKTRALHKNYKAVVYLKDDDVVDRSRQLEDLMLKNPSTNMAEIVTEKYAKVSGKDLPKDVKKAKLTYQILAQTKINEKASIGYADICLETGRFHQIRAQMAQAKMPLLGDQKYATPEAKEVSSQLQVKTVALCASQLSFIHPKTKKEMSFSCIPKGTIFQQFLNETEN